MVVGHFGVGLAAKRVAPQVPLAVLLVAANLLDVLFLVFWLAGIEHYSETSIVVNAWSHGLLMSVFWSVTTGTITFLFSHDRRTSVVIGLLVFSHWMLDLVAHNPELPLLFNGSPLVGLSLEWSYTDAGYVIHWTQALMAEFGLLAAGIVIYLTSRKKSTNAPATAHNTPNNDAPSSS